MGNTDRIMHFDVFMASARQRTFQLSHWRLNTRNGCSTLAGMQALSFSERSMSEPHVVCFVPAQKNNLPYVSLPSG